jgi:hypothetical protein
MVIESSELASTLRTEVSQERIEKALNNINEKIKYALLQGESSLHVLELMYTLGDYHRTYSKPKWFFQMPQKLIQIAGAAKELFKNLEKMGLKPELKEVFPEFENNFYEIRIHF